MSLRKFFLFVLLTTVFRLVGTQAELGQPMQQVHVKVGDTAVLPCNVAALMNGEDSENSFYIRWITNDGPVCEFTEGKSHCYGDYRFRTEISKEKNSKHLYHLIINETRLSDEGKYYCILQKRGRNGEDVVSVQLIVQVVGSQAELGQPLQQVHVKVGDTAVLPCNVLAPMNGETEDGLYIWWVTNDGPVCEFAEGKSHCYGDYRHRTEISKEKNSEHLYHLIINETRLSDEGKYYCKLQKPGGNGEDVVSVQLIVQGHEENVSVVFGKTLAIRLPVTESAVRFAPASSSTEADVCTVRQNTLTPASAYASRAALKNKELRLDRVTFADEGSYSVIDVATERVMKIVVLAVEGLVENLELHEGDNLTIPLCCLSSPYIEFCGPAGNSIADGVCQGHVERLTVQNGFVTLSNFTAKDQGKYIVREKMGGVVVLTLTLTLKTIPVGWHWSVWVLAGILALLLLVGISVCAIKWYKRRQMEREMRRLAEKLNEQFPLREIKSSGDVEEK